MNDHTTLPSLAISIAGIRVNLLLDGLSAAHAAVTAERYAAFTTPAAGPAAITVRLHMEPGPDFIPFHPEGPFQVHSRRLNDRIEFESHYEKGWVDRARGEAALVMRDKGDPENFLRVIYAWLCIEQRSLLIHASGVIRHGSGYVFFGHSESGKTTVAQLSLEHTVLSDDLVILKQQADGIWAFGVPFRGRLVEAPRTNAAAPLKGLYTLVKDSEHRLAPTPPVEATARLASCIPFVMEQPANAARVIDICSEIQARVPVQALHFRKDAGFWRVIDGTR
ncbi:MAG: hypothetical protein WCF84_00625 [Anaerolineae bacterium]